VLEDVYKYSIFESENWDSKLGGVRTPRKPGLRALRKRRRWFNGEDVRNEGVMDETNCSSMPLKNLEEEFRRLPSQITGSQYGCIRGRQVQHGAPCFHAAQHLLVLEQQVHWQSCRSRKRRCKVEIASF